jgi:hypothetical protein
MLSVAGTSSFILQTKKKQIKNNVNKPPIALAGSDQLITLPTDSVLLDSGTPSNPGGSISSYLLTKIPGPASLFYFLSNEIGSIEQNFLLRMNAGIYSTTKKLSVIK